MSWHGHSRWRWEKLSVNNDVSFILLAFVDIQFVSTVAQRNKSRTFLHHLYKLVRTQQAAVFISYPDNSSSPVILCPVWDIMSMSTPCTTRLLPVLDWTHTWSIRWSKGVIIRQRSPEVCGRFHLLWRLAADWQNGTLRRRMMKMNEDVLRAAVGWGCTNFIFPEVIKISVILAWIYNSDSCPNSLQPPARKGPLTSLWLCCNSLEVSSLPERGLTKVKALQTLSE